MRTQQLTLPEKSAVQMPHRARAQCHALARRPVIFRHSVTRDGIKEFGVRRRRLMCFRRGPLAYRRPVHSPHYLHKQKNEENEAHVIS